MFRSCRILAGSRRLSPSPVKAEMFLRARLCSPAPWGTQASTLDSCIPKRLPGIPELSGPAILAVKREFQSQLRYFSMVKKHSWYWL